MHTIPINGNFVDEGLFLAMPAGFPGVSEAPPREHTRLHRLHPGADQRTVFALSRGPDPQLIQFCPKSTYGFAVVLPPLADCDEITALVSREKKYAQELLVASENQQGSRVTHSCAANIGHAIQEWHVSQWKPAPNAIDFPGERLLDLAADTDPTLAWALFSDKCVLLEWDASALKIRKEFPLPAQAQPFLFQMEGAPHYADKSGGIWKLGPESINKVQQLPELADALRIRACKQGLVWATRDGEIHSWEPNDAGSVKQSQLPLTPVHSLVRIADGRIYASAGESIAHWFVIEPDTGRTRDLGVPVSTLSNRRYGFNFADLIPGRDGEIYAAENDHGGQLWIYFPAYPG